jgi:hypothetical protein
MCKMVTSVVCIKIPIPQTLLGRLKSPVRGKFNHAESCIRKVPLNRKLKCLAVSVCFALVASPCLAQARIDPSLPEAPLPHRRVLVLFPTYETVDNPFAPVPPLRIRQKYELAYREIVDPSFLVPPIAAAAWDQATGFGPGYGQGWGPFAQRFGYSAANSASSYFFSDALLPSLLHQDPRYFRKGTGSIKSRVWWAVRSQLICYDDRGAQVANYPNLIGFGMSQALSNAYIPPSNRTLGSNLTGYIGKIGISAAANLMREFGEGVPAKLTQDLKQDIKQDLTHQPSSEPATPPPGDH